MRLSSLADYAIVMMSATARRCGGASRVNATLLAAETGLPLPTVQKLVSRLAAAGLIESSRGTGGGFRLSRPAAAISLADLIEAVEGPIALTTCVDDARHDCALEGDCRVKPHWRVVNAAVRDALAGVSLARLSALSSVDVTKSRPARQTAVVATATTGLMEMATRNAEAHAAANKAYEWGFHSDIEQEFAPKGLSEDTVRFISAKKNEPGWMLDWRLKAYRHWLTMTPPDWAKLDIAPIDYQAAYYYAEPKAKPRLNSLDEVDPEILRVYEKLGIPISEQKLLAGVDGGVASNGGRRVAVDAVFDSVSVATTFRAELEAAGVIFRSISEAIREFPDLVRKWLGKIVPSHDNFFAALNCAVFSDGTFVYIPEGVRCPMELSTYFRINAENTGQFERTLIVADKGAYVSYLEGCTAPMRDENQLHAAVVELVILDDAEIKYSTVQNWYPGDADGKGGIYNFVTKRALCQGRNAKVSWTQVETGSAITWKYPSCVLSGENSVGEFYSVAVTNNRQQADTGTKMIHLGSGSRSTIVAKGISAGRSDNSYRGLVRVAAGAEGVRNFTQCDSLLLGDQCGAHTIPYIEVRNPSAQIEHEATTSKISDDQLFYAMQRGLDQEAAVALIVNGFARDVLRQLPMEFAVEAQKLLGISLEGSVG